MPVNPPKLFDYLDFREFLQDWLSSMRESSSDFSLRTFSSIVSPSLASSGLLSAVIKGKRQLSPSVRVKVAKAMKLSMQQTEYFDLLVQFNQAKAMQEKNHYFALLSKFRSSKAEKIQSGQYKFWSQWYYPVLWSFFGIHSTQRNPVEIAKRISPQLTPAQVSEAIQTLLELKLIKKTANGYTPVNKHITTEKEVQDMAAFQHHSQFLNLAVNRMEEVEADKRQFNTLVFYISEQGFNSIKERLASFQEELRDIIDKDSKEDRVYGLGMQFYPMTKNLSTSR